MNKSVDYFSTLVGRPPLSARVSSSTSKLKGGARPASTHWRG
jgi:hypothetical protein